MAVIDPFEVIRSRARKFVIMPADDEGVRCVYAITHAHSPEMAALPALDVGSLTEQLEQAQRAERRLAACKTPEETAKVQEELVAAADRVKAALVSDLAGTPQKEAAYLMRCRATVMQAVRGVGIARDDVQEGVCPTGTVDADICIELGTDAQGPIYVRPLRFVDGAADKAKGEISILDIADGELMRMQMLFSAAFSQRASVIPLRGQSGTDAVGGSDGEALRPASEPVPDRPGPIRGDAGRVGGKSRKGVRSGG